MALSLAESAALINNPDFRGRVKAAALRYANYMAAQPGNSNSRTVWAQHTMQSPDAAAQMLVGSVVMNVNVQSFGEDINDDNLSAAVQATADMMI